jgi:L-lactate dehydrogenase complex protein LldF
MAHEFPSNARKALGDAELRRALSLARGGFVDKRRMAVDALPEFEALRTTAKQIKEHTLAHLDFYLERFERKAVENGGVVHWATSAAQARDIAVRICAEAGATKILKGKTMVGEEVAVNDALAKAGYDFIETDLGEYIIQLADEPPSHIIAPAVHKTRQQIVDLFTTHHAPADHTAPLDEIPAIVNEARQVLRRAFLAGDVGITGANFLLAESGSSVIVTNEGNGDLSSLLPRVHIVTAGIEKVLPTFEDMCVLLRLLGRSATGQEMSSYTTVSTGPRRDGDLDGPEQYHVILVDNGRSRMLGSEFREMLRCIRCGACLNHCPVYGSVGGHSYGWVYPGPMGSVLTPLIVGLDKARHLPNACTLNGRCQEVCPMSIPLPKMLRRLRMREFESRLTPARLRFAIRGWAWLATRPRLYRWVTGAAARVLGLLGRRRGRFHWLPFAGGWTSVRDLPAPSGETFHAAWRRHAGKRR